MPAAVAIRSSPGIALAIVSRIEVMEMTRKRTPAQKIIPSATCHQTFCVKMIVNHDYVGHREKRCDAGDSFGTDVG